MVRQFFYLIIDHNDMIILCDFAAELLRIGDALAGGTGDLIVRIILPDVFLQKRRKHNDFIHAVVCKMHYRVAEFIAEMLLFKHGVCECEAERDTSVVVGPEHTLDEVCSAEAVLYTSAVPH